MQKKKTESDKCLQRKVWKKVKPNSVKNLIDLNSNVRIVNSAGNEIYFCSQNFFLIAYAN